MKAPGQTLHIVPLIYHPTVKVLELNEALTKVDKINGRQKCRLHNGVPFLSFWQLPVNSVCLIASLVVRTLSMHERTKAISRQTVHYCMHISVLVCIYARIPVVTILFLATEYKGSMLMHIIHTVFLCFKE